MTAARIGLFGGTFDPFHNGHLFLINQAMQQSELDSIIVLPCQISPHKINSDINSPLHRITMARLACAECENIIVDDFELTQAPPSYSWRTVEHFRTIMPDAELFWILGYDQWQALPQWANPQYLANHLTFLVFARKYMPENRTGWRMKPINGTHPASATAIRSTDSAHFLDHDWLHPNVLHYIEENGLYRKV